MLKTQPALHRPPPGPELQRMIDQGPSDRVRHVADRCHITVTRLEDGPYRARVKEYRGAFAHRDDAEEARVACYDSLLVLIAVGFDMDLPLPPSLASDD